MKAKRSLCACLCVALLLSIFCIPAQASGPQASPFDGQGTQEQPYLIGNTRQIWTLARLVNGGDEHYAGACYRLSANIDLGPADWVPIGLTEDTPFRGVFDGDGYGVTGIQGRDYRNWQTFQRPELEYTDPETMMSRLPDEVLDQFPVGGFFGVTQGAVIDDLYIEGEVFGLRHCGGLVGWAKDSQIRNCVVRTDQIARGESWGMIVGRSEGSLMENSCYIPKREGGGIVDLVGPRDGATRIVNSFSTGRLSINGKMENHSNYYYRGDGSQIQAWESHHDMGQETFAVSISELGQELNAWVDSQEPGKYRRWRTLEEGDDTAWPVMEGRKAVTDMPDMPSGSMDNFSMAAPAISYPDVDANAWYGVNGENVVEDVTRLGLFVGRDDGRFAPEEPLLLCEAVKLAAVVRGIYTADGYVFDQTEGERWFDTYVDYAVDHGLAYDWELDDLDRPATRLETAYLLGGALPSWELTRTSGQKQFYPDDIENEPHRYFWRIFDLYIGGVLRGADQDGNFYPDRTITRAETAAILTRLVWPERRVVS